jgi:DNA (cytosine-5)-methyltransferase 1
MPSKRKHKKRSNRTLRAKGIKAVDLSCGAGGLTRGLEAASIDVVIGVDIDPACEYPYTANNGASFLLKPVEKISGPSDERWNLLQHVSRLVREAQPDLVTIANVPRLQSQRIFSAFLADLRDEFEVNARDRQLCRLRRSAAASKARPAGPLCQYE